MRSSNDARADPHTATHYVLGGDRVGTAIAERLHTGGHHVAVVDDAYEPAKVPGIAGDPASVDVLARSGIDSGSTVLVVTPSDRRNLLIAQLVRARFDVQRVIARVNDPDRVPVFADAGHEPFCATTTLAEAAGEAV